VVVLTVMLPVSAVHVIVNAALAVPPAVTVTVCEAPPLTLQLLGAPPRVTVWLPVASPENVTLPDAPIA
jgi:hypothetical protein